MPSISVLPGVGTQSADIAVAVLPDGSAAPKRVPIDATGATGAPMTDVSAQRFVAAVNALAAVLTPRPVVAQRGPFLFGFPI